MCLSLPRGVAPPSAADDVTPHGEPWFHGKITRHEVEALLQQDGHFLVRESTHSPGQYVLSGRHQGRIKHLLLIDPEGIVSTARSRARFLWMTSCVSWSRILILGCH